MSLEILKQEAVSISSSPQRLKEIAAINNDLARLVATNPIADGHLLAKLALQAKKTKI